MAVTGPIFPAALVAAADQLYAETTTLLDDLVANARRDLAADLHDLDVAQRHATLTAVFATSPRRDSCLAACLALALLRLAERRGGDLA